MIEQIKQRMLEAQTTKVQTHVDEVERALNEPPKKIKRLGELNELHRGSRSYVRNCMTSAEMIRRELMSSLWR